MRSRAAVRKSLRWAVASYRRFRLKRRAHLRWAVGDRSRMEKRAATIRMVPELSGLRKELKKHALDVVRFEGVMSPRLTSRAYSLAHDKFSGVVDRWRLAVQPHIFPFALQRGFDRMGVLNDSRGKILRARLRDVMLAYDYDHSFYSLRVLEPRVWALLGKKDGSRFLNTFEVGYQQLHLMVGTLSIRDMPF